MHLRGTLYQQSASLYSANGCPLCCPVYRNSPLFYIEMFKNCQSKCWQGCIVQDCNWDYDLKKISMSAIGQQLTINSLTANNWDVDQIAFVRWTFIRQFKTISIVLKDDRKNPITVRSSEDIQNRSSVLRISSVSRLKPPRLANLQRDKSLHLSLKFTIVLWVFVGLIEKD